MGKFHQLRVIQRLLHKRHFPKVYRKWYVDAKTFADGSIDQAFEGPTIILLSKYANAYGVF